MQSTAQQRPPQTSAQWAVRWHGLVVATLLVLGVPLVHLGWHVVLGHEAPPIVTRSQTPSPTVAKRTLRDGSWMLAFERHLREASPMVWWLRSRWNEFLWRAGVPQSAAVHVGRDGWLFMAPEVVRDAERLRETGARRRQFLAEVRERMRAAGCDLLVSLVPDKERVYADFTRAGAIAPQKAPAYAILLEDLRAAGVPAIDVASSLAAARAAAPAEELFYRCDTHWRPAGALAAGRAVAAAIEQAPFVQRLSPRQHIELGARTQVPALGDLVAQLGLATVELPGPGGGTRTVAMSLLTAGLVEPRDYYAVTMRGAAGNVPLSGRETDAEVLLIGTSFAGENGLPALCLSLGRPVRGILDSGASGLLPLQKALAELAQGTRARLVVWEVVERGFFEPGWADPRL